jgi:hypothetical protein
MNKFVFWCHFKIVHFQTVSLFFCVILHLASKPVRVIINEFVPLIFQKIQDASLKLSLLKFVEIYKIKKKLTFVSFDWYWTWASSEVEMYDGISNQRASGGWFNIILSSSSLQNGRVPTARIHQKQLHMLYKRHFVKFHLIVPILN